MFSQLGFNNVYCLWRKIFVGTKKHVILLRLHLLWFLTIKYTKIKVTIITYSNNDITIENKWNTKPYVLFFLQINMCIYFLKTKHDVKKSKIKYVIICCISKFDFNSFINIIHFYSLCFNNKKNMFFISIKGLKLCHFW